MTILLEPLKETQGVDCFLHTQAMRTVAVEDFLDAFLRIHQEPTSPVPVSTNDIGSGTTVAIPLKAVDVCT